MAVTVVWHIHTTVWLLKNCSQRILTYYMRILLLDLTYGRTMYVAHNKRCTNRLPLRLLFSRF